MIDLHCHVLPGVDDGPATLGEALALAREAGAAGIATIVATPHVTFAYPRNDADRIHAATAALQDELDAAGIPVRVLPGAEVAITRAAELDDDELRRLALGGGPWLLVECPISAALASAFPTAARGLAGRGHRILLAHPERSPVFQRDPAALDALVEDGMLAQVTAGALTGRFGRTVRQAALRLVGAGLVHVVASDAHGRDRPASIAAELEAAGLGELAPWLADAVPAALLAGTDPPPPPAPPPAPSSRGLRGLVERARRVRRA